MKQQTKRLLKSLCMAVGVVLLSAVDPLAGYAAERTIDIKHLGEGQSIVRVDAQAQSICCFRSRSPRRNPSYI